MVKDGSGYARIERGVEREFPYFTLVIAIRSRIFSFVDRYIESFANWLRTIRSRDDSISPCVT